MMEGRLGKMRTGSMSVRNSAVIMLAGQDDGRVTTCRLTSFEMQFDSDRQTGREKQ